MAIFRRNVEVIPRISRGRPGYLVRDPGTDAVYELRQEDYVLCRLLDGTTPGEEVRRRYEAECGAGLSAEQLDAFIRQLDRQGLLEPGSGPPRRRRTLPEFLAPEEFIVERNLPFADGDPLFGRLARAFGWIFSRPMQWLGWVLIAAGFDILIVEWDRLAEATAALWGPQFFITLIVPAALLLRSVRSIIQGIHSKRHGGHIREIGLTFLYYLLPSIYCDWWSDVVWIREKKDRFYRLAAGLYLQAVLWSIAIIGWRFSDPTGLPATLWLAACIAATLNFVLANANPLVQLEGYLILMNWLEVPRLRERANAIFGSWLAMRPAPEPLTSRQYRWFVLYGGLSFVFVVFMIALHIFFTWSSLVDALEGAGALLTIAICLYAFQKPLLAWLRGLRWVRWVTAPARPWRLRLAAGGAAACSVAVLLFPYPYESGGPFVLLPAARVQVRTEVAGLVEEVLVREGDRVEAGQALVRLSARDSGRNLEAALGQLEAARAQRLLLETGPRPEVIDRAEAAVLTARITLDWSRALAERAKALHGQQLVSEQDYENAVRQRDMDAQRLAEAQADLAVTRSGARPEAIEAARALVRGLEARVDNFRTDVARATVRSPITGRVTTPHIEELAGVYLRPGQRDLVADIEDARTLRAEVEVPERETAGLRPGAAVEAIAWAYHRTTFHGTVTGIAPVAATGSAGTTKVAPAAGPSREAGVAIAADGDRVVRVITEIANPDGLLRSEMTGYAKVASGTRPVWDVLLRPFIRWCMVEVWSWIP